MNQMMGRTVKTLVILTFITLGVASTTLPSHKAEPAAETKQKSAGLAAGLQKINDGLYAGKAADKFYLAMERITPENIQDWIDYAQLQVTAGSRMGLKYLQNTDGSGHFAKVLTAYKSGIINNKNDLWVAYTSDVPVTKNADLKTYIGAENPRLEMFVTVISSPDALITSHMGISRTWEAALDLQQTPPTRAKHADQSVHLHSFAAKVMKARDPKKVYMLTAPAIAMRDILIKKMPANSVFVGDSLYQNKLEAGEKNPQSLIDEYALRERKNETAQEREARLKKAADLMYRFYNIKEKLPLLKTNPPRIIKTKESSRKLTLQKPDGSPLATFDQSTPVYQWLFTDAYEDGGLKLPYTLIDLEKLAAVTQLLDGAETH